MSNVIPNRFRVVVLGKTGSGKSSVCNRLIGHVQDDVFPVFEGMIDGNTTDFQSYGDTVDGIWLQVVDTYDTVNVVSEPSKEFVKKLQSILEKEERAERETTTAKKMATTEENSTVVEISSAMKEHKSEENILTVFVFTVSMAARFTPDDYELYKQFYAELIPKKYKNNLIIAFTNIDQPENYPFLDSDGRVDLHKIKHANLRELLQMAKDRCIVVLHQQTEAQRQQVISDILQFLKNMGVAADGDITKESVPEGHDGMAGVLVTGGGVFLESLHDKLKKFCVIL